MIKNEENEMNIVIINGQNHKGSTYHIGRMLAERVGSDEEFSGSSGTSMACAPTKSRDAYKAGGMYFNRSGRGNEEHEQRYGRQPVFLGRVENI